MTNLDLLRYRERLKLDQTAMAEFLAVPRGTYIKWENGERRLNSAATNLVQLMQAIEKIAPAVFNAMLPGGNRHG